MLEFHEPPGEFLTRGAAAYPSELNRALAEALAAAVNLSSQLPKSVTHSWASSTQDISELRDKPVFTLPLRGSIPKVDDSSSDRFSLRNVHKSVDTKMLNIGKQIANLIERKLDRNPEVQSHILGNLGKPADEISMPDDWIDGLREEVLQVLVRNRSAEQPTNCSLGSVPWSDPPL